MTRFLQCILLLGVLDHIAAKSFELDLRKKLLENYDPMTLPAPLTEVTVGFTIIDYEVKEADQTLNMNIWMRFIWEDQQLTWDPNKYPQIKKLTFDPNSVWKPDFYLYNNADHANFEIYGQTKVLSMVGKGMLWVPPSHVKAMCVMDLTYWPYDTQLCQAKFGSWVHSAEEMVLKSHNTSIDFEEVSLHSHKSPQDVPRRGWDVLETYTEIVAKKYDCCEEDYQSVSIFMKMKRNEPAYCWLVGVPCFVIGFISLLVFLLPPSASEKIFLAAIIFLGNLLFLTALSKLIEHTAHNPPLIVQMVSWQLILIGSELIISIMVIRLTRQPFVYRLPSFIETIAKKFSGILGLGSYVNVMEKDGSMQDGSIVGQSHQSKCLLVGAFIDRICFFIYAFIYIIFLIRFPIFS